MRKARKKPSRRYSLNRVKQAKTYEPIDIAKLFGIHRNTIGQWLKQGLQAIDNGRPIVVRGAELKAFLGERQEARKQTCRLNELYCFRCRAPRTPWGAMADVVPVTAKTAKLSALCLECETPMHRMISRDDLVKLAATIDLSELPPERLTD